jgi:hypothetical protein
VNISLQGVTSLAPTGKALTLSSKSTDETNSIDDPTHLVPVESEVTGVGPSFSYTFAPYSVTVLQIATQEAHSEHNLPTAGPMSLSMPTGTTRFSKSSFNFPRPTLRFADTWSCFAVQ